MKLPDVLKSEKKSITEKEWGKVISLIDKAILELIAFRKNEGKVLERTYALKAIWEDDTYFNARSMDVYIAKLRKHLKQDDTIEIMNVHGRGFRFLVHK